MRCDDLLLQAFHRARLSRFRPLSTLTMLSVAVHCGSLFLGSSFPSVSHPSLLSFAPVTVLFLSRLVVEQLSQLHYIPVFSPNSNGRRPLLSILRNGQLLPPAFYAAVVVSLQRCFSLRSPPEKSAFLCLRAYGQ